MGAAQFFNSICQLCQAEHANSLCAIGRHLLWQLRKVTRGFPTVLHISKSRLYVEQAGGVAALVNSLGVYDYNNMNLIRLLLEQTNGMFFDVGANVGSYTLIASEAPGTVICFEPHPGTFRALCRNIRLNHRNNVGALNVAVSDCEGYIMLTDQHLSSINHIVNSGEAIGETIRVRATTLDSTCRRLCVCPDIVKIDVEGYETKVLDGFRTGCDAADVILVEHGERDEIRDHPTLAAFVGPWFFHFDARRFVRTPQKRMEDAVYVHRDAVERMRSWGLSFRDQAHNP